jgi:hypothetical protein
MNNVAITTNRGENYLFEGARAVVRDYHGGAVLVVKQEEKVLAMFPFVNIEVWAEQ